MKRTPSPALVISILALFVALSGSAYAAVKINGKNIKRGTVTSTQIKNKSIKKIDLAKDARIAGPKGDKGDPGLGAAGSTVPSKTTISGAWSVSGGNPTVGSKTFYSAASFPVPAPQIVVTADVNFAPDSDAD